MPDSVSAGVTTLDNTDPFLTKALTEACDFVIICIEEELPIDGQSSEDLIKK